MAEVMSRPDRSRTVFVALGMLGLVGLLVLGAWLRFRYRPSGLQVVMIAGQAKLDVQGERRYAMIGDVLAVGGHLVADQHAAIRFMDENDVRLEFIGTGRMARRDTRACILMGGTLLLQVADDPWSCVVPTGEVMMSGSAAISVVDQDALVVVHDGTAVIDTGGRHRSVAAGTAVWMDALDTRVLPSLLAQWDFENADSPSAEAVALTRVQHSPAVTASDGGEWWVHGHAEKERWALARWPVPSHLTVRSIAWRLRQMQCSDDGRWLIAVEDAAGQQHRLAGGDRASQDKLHIGQASWEGDDAVAVLLGLEEGSAVLVLEEILLLGPDDG